MAGEATGLAIFAMRDKGELTNYLRVEIPLHRE